MIKLNSSLAKSFMASDRPSSSDSPENQSDPKPSADNPPKKKKKPFEWPRVITDELPEVVREYQQIDPSGHDM